MTPPRPVSHNICYAIHESHVKYNNSLSDAELVTLIHRGDWSAFDAIMSRHGPRLFRIAVDILNNNADAEDAVQQSFLHAILGLPGFRCESTVSTWLTRILLNEAFGRLRRRRPVVGLEALESFTEAEAVRVSSSDALLQRNPESLVARGKIRRLLARAIDDLPEPFRTVFLMRKVEDMSTQETAAALGLRPDTVKTRLHRAHQRLRGTLAGQLGCTMTEILPF
jgi:RNA polymerase sigma-70 factor, ECF subfamily